MNLRHLLLLFFLFQFSIIIGFCQTDKEIESVYNSYASIEDDFERLDSLKFFIHPKNGGDMRQSIKLLEKERDALGAISEKPLQHVLINNLLFKCYRSINEYQRGVSYLITGNEIANKYSEQEGEWQNALADLNLETAFVYYLEQKPKEAFAYATRAINGFKQLGNNKKLSEAYWRLGIAKSQMGKTQEALAYYEDAEKVIDPEKEEANYLRVQYLKSIELSIQNRFNEARKVLLKILPKMEASNHINYAVALAKMGHVETQLGNLFPAKKYLTEAEELKINTTDLNAKGVIAHRFEEYYLATGQFQNAYDQLAIRKSIADSIARKRVQQETIAFQNRFNDLSQQQAIKDLKYEQVIQESKIKSWLGILSGLFLATISFLGLWWYRRNKKRKEAELIASKETELNEAKENLTASITQNLRVPLALIMEQLDTLKNEPLSNHASLLLNSSQKSSNRLLHQVHQLKDLNQLQNKSSWINEENGDIILFLEETISRLKASEREKEFFWTKNFEHESFLCKLDYEKLNSILTNLISNAINTYPSGSEIKLSFSQKRDYIVITLIDNRPEIHPKDQNHIFDWNLESGIGLALSKELAELMNGTLKLQTDIDQVAQFVLEIPFKKVDKSVYEKIEQINLSTTQNENNPSGQAQ